MLNSLLLWSTEQFSSHHFVLFCGFWDTWADRAVDISVPVVDMPSLRPHNAVPCSSLDSFRRFLPAKPTTTPSQFQMFFHYLILILIVTIATILGALPALFSFFLGHQSTDATYTQLSIFNNFSQFVVPSLSWTLMMCHLALPMQGIRPQFRLRFLHSFGNCVRCTCVQCNASVSCVDRTRTPLPHPTDQS